MAAAIMLQLQGTVGCLCWCFPISLNPGLGMLTHHTLLMLLLHLQRCPASTVAAFAASLRQRVSRVALGISIIGLNCHVVYSCLTMPHHATVYGLVVLSLLAPMAQYLGNAAACNVGFCCFVCQRLC